VLARPIGKLLRKCLRLHHSSAYVQRTMWVLALSREESEHLRPSILFLPEPEERLRLELDALGVSSVTTAQPESAARSTSC